MKGLEEGLGGGGELAWLRWSSANAGFGIDVLEVSSSSPNVTKLQHTLDASQSGL